MSSAPGRMLSVVLLVGGMSAAGAAAQPAPVWERDLRAAIDQLGDFDYDGLFGMYKYGPAAEREPSRSNTIYRVNPEVPNGVEAVTIFQSSHAADFDF